MKAILTSALASFGLALTPLAALDAQGTGAGNVSFEAAMACSSLYTVLAAAAENAPEYDEFIDLSTRWLVIATVRDGREEVVPEETLIEWVEELLSELEAQDSDEMREAFLYEGIEICEANRVSIADEFESIGLE